MLPPATLLSTLLLFPVAVLVSWLQCDTPKAESRRAACVFLERGMGDGVRGPI